MKSGLEGRNNLRHYVATVVDFQAVSMKSGLEGRNNATGRNISPRPVVSQ